MHRRMVSTVAVTGLALVLAVLMPSPAEAAPGGAGPAATPSPEPSRCRTIDVGSDPAGCVPVSLPGTQWDLDPASLGVPVPAGVLIGFDFTATAMSGSTGCNGFWAEYTVGADGSFKRGQLVMTARVCDTPVAAVERAFLRGLTAAKRIAVTRTELRLLDGDKTLMRLVPAPSAA